MNANQILERLKSISNSLEPITTKRLIEIDKEKRELLLSCSEVITSTELDQIEQAYKTLHTKCADLYMKIGMAEYDEIVERNPDELFFWTQGNNGSMFASLVVVAKNETSARAKMAHYPESYLAGCEIHKHKITDKFEAKTYSFIVQ